MMAANETVIDNPLTMKKLENHLIKTIVAALAIGLCSAFATSYGFYYKASDDIEELKSSKVEMREDIKELKSAVSDIKIALSNTGIYTDENKDKIKNLEQDVKDIKTQQDDIVKLLYEIKARQH